MKKSVIFIAITVALGGCKTQLSSDLFIGDLIAATEGETLTAPLVVAMEASGSDCENKAPDFQTALQTQMNSVEFIGCEKIDFQTYARFRAQASIIPLNGELFKIDKAFAIGVAVKNDLFVVSYLTDPDSTRAIWDALPEEMTQYREFELEPTLSAIVNNDLRNNVTIITDDVFADGVPIQGTQERQIGRRGQVEISLSNVTNAAFGNVENSSQIFTFSLEK